MLQIKRHEVIVRKQQMEELQQYLQQGWVGTALFWRQQWIVEFRQESC